MSNSMILIGLLFAIVLFFWGIYKAVKTHKNVYIFAMLPFFLILAGMFIR